MQFKDENNGQSLNSFVKSDTGKSGGMTTEDREAPFIISLSAAQRAAAMNRFSVLRPILEDEVPVVRAAATAGVAPRTLHRWLADYQRAGLSGLARKPRADRGKRKFASEIIALIEGLALRRPQPSVAAIHRRVHAAAVKHGLAAPSLSSVHAIIGALDAGMVTLALEGPAAYRDRFELIHRHRAERPNAVWQADHTQLDVLVLDANARPVRPWLTTVIDDHSRAIAGYTVFLGAPSAMQTALALRQAIWRKADPAWPVCGLPDILYVDHGSDFTSTHLEQVAADLHFQLIFSGVARPQGRGKVERLFGTLNTELLAELPGHLVEGRAANPPRLSLAEFDAKIGDFLVGIYNLRVHSGIGEAPRASWLGTGWLPRMPDSLEALDELLVMVAKPRMVRRDGIRFQGLRYVDPLLAAHVGESVTIRYDPRDLAEIRVFYRGRFLCRAVDPEHSGHLVTLKDIQTARQARRRALREQINERVARVADFLPEARRNTATLAATTPRPRPVSKLRIYSEDE